MIAAIAIVMSRPVTLIVITVLMMLASVYGALTVEILDMIRLVSLAALNMILFGVQMLYILVYRHLHQVHR